MDDIRILLQPWYLQIKFVHLLMVAMWSFSTAVAYRNYVVPVFLAWQKDPHNPELQQLRNLAIERFDKGAVLEHFAFPVIILSGMALTWIAGWNWSELSWLSVKLAIILLIFIPIEVADYYLAHFGGNKRRIRHAGDKARYEDMIRIHWRFLRITTPLVVIFIPALFYLAATKPL